MNSALQLCTLGLRGDFFRRGFSSSTDAKLKKKKKNRKKPRKKHRNSSSELSICGICADVGVQQSASCYFKEFASHRQILKVKLKGNQYYPDKGGRSSSGERKFLADFQYHRVMQV